MDHQLNKLFGDYYYDAQDDFIDMFVGAINKQGKPFGNKLRTWMKHITDFTDMSLHYEDFPVSPSVLTRWLESEDVMECCRLLKRAKENGTLKDTNGMITKQDVTAIYKYALARAKAEDDLNTMARVAKQLAELHGLHVNKHEVNQTQPTLIKIVEDTADESTDD